MKTKSIPFLLVALLTLAACNPHLAETTGWLLENDSGEN